MPTTTRFKRRFNQLSIKEKMNCVEVIARAVLIRQMPGGRDLYVSERKALEELLEWCNLNMFFDVLPGRTEKD